MLRMVHLVTLPGTFQARVVVARLGAAGIVSQLRGAVDGPYPFGEVMVDVAEDDFDLARELLLESEVESSFAPPARRHRRTSIVLPVVVIVVLVLVSLVSRFH